MSLKILTNIVYTTKAIAPLILIGFKNKHKLTEAQINRASCDLIVQLGYLIYHLESTDCSRGD